MKSKSQGLNTVRICFPLMSQSQASGEEELRPSQKLRIPGSFHLLLPPGPWSVLHAQADGERSRRARSWTGPPPSHRAQSYSYAPRKGKMGGSVQLCAQGKRGPWGLGSLGLVICGSLSLLLQGRSSVLQTHSAPFCASQIYPFPATSLVPSRFSNWNDFLAQIPPAAHR